MSLESVEKELEVTRITEDTELKDVSDIGRFIIGERSDKFGLYGKPSVTIARCTYGMITIEEQSIAFIDDNCNIDELNVYGSCVVKKSEIGTLKIGRIGRIYILEDCKIDELDVNGAVLSLSHASSISDIRLHPGGKIRLSNHANKQDDICPYYGMDAESNPLQPRNIHLDAGRNWRYEPFVTSNSGVTYWAFG